MISCLFSCVASFYVRVLKNESLQLFQLQINLADSLIAEEEFHLTLDIKIYVKIFSSFLSIPVNNGVFID